MCNLVLMIFVDASQIVFLFKFIKLININISLGYSYLIEFSKLSQFFFLYEAIIKKKRSPLLLVLLVCNPEIWNSFQGTWSYYIIFPCSLGSIWGVVSLFGLAEEPGTPASLLSTGKHFWLYFVTHLFDPETLTREVHVWEILRAAVLARCLGFWKIFNTSFLVRSTILQKKKVSKTKFFNTL